MSEQRHQPETYQKKSSTKASSRRMEKRGEKRSGSDSNAHSGRKRSRLHEGHRAENVPVNVREPSAEFAGDLHAADRTGENPTRLPGARSAEEVKSMHAILAGLTDDELKNITILPAGTRLEQGAKYIDLRHLEEGEFIATSTMVADGANAYVSKKDTDYLLWNRLNRVQAPARLDEPL
ncbi:MAG: hypothetical protein ACLQUY_24235 [Ktedonobacterales bacterium]